MKVIDTVEKEIEADGQRFGACMSDEEVAAKRKKKYVFCPFFNFIEPASVWSQIKHIDVQ